MCYVTLRTLQVFWGCKVTTFHFCYNVTNQQIIFLHKAKTSLKRGAIS